MPPHAPHEPGAAAAAPRPRRPLLEDPVRPDSWCAGARSCTTASCCRTSSQQDFDDVLDELRQAGLPVRGRVVRAALRVPLPAFGARRAGAASTWSCARRSSRGTSSARRRRRAARRATSIRRSSALQVKVSGHDRRPARRRLQRPARAAAPDGRPTASSSPACATAPGSRRPACTRPSRSTRRWSSTSSTPGWAARWAAAPTTSPTPAAAPRRRAPVNANEAEGRRLARFERMGHTAGSAPFQAAEINPDYPFTLDLRR